jgi:hypothetical protein
VGSANLDALHDDQGKHLYVAKTTTSYQFVISQLVPRSVGGLDSAFLAPEEHAIENPSEECLENMLILAGGDATEPAQQAAEVRHFAWLALHDASALSRERALVEIGRTARRLQLGQPERPPEVTVGPVELSEALVAMVDALRPILSPAAPASEGEQTSLEAACAQMESLAVDVEGGRRILRAIENVTRGQSATRPALAPLYRLSQRVQMQVVRAVLGEAVLDPHERVRAAAMRANWEAFGHAFLLFQLLDLERTFLRRAAWRYEVEDVVALFELVRRHGLPVAAGSTEGESKALRYRLLLLLTNVAISVGDFDEHVRGAAMRALPRASGAQLESLRFEDWAAWWQANESLLRPSDGELGESQP